MNKIMEIFILVIQTQILRLHTVVQIKRSYVTVLTNMQHLLYVLRHTKINLQSVF